MSSCDCLRADAGASDGLDTPFAPAASGAAGVPDMGASVAGVNSGVSGGTATS